jgi:uncharacterized membrane protein YdbT with pleckstrin-like domain
VGYVDDSLAPGEFVVGRARLHPVVMLPGLLVSWTFILLPLLVAEWLTWHTTEMAVTNQRLILKRGWVSRHAVEMQLAKIEHIGVDQGALGRFFGYGTIAVRGTGGSLEPFKGVWNPLAFRQAVQGQIGVAPTMQIA